MNKLVSLVAALALAGCGSGGGGGGGGSAAPGSPAPGATTPTTPAAPSTTGLSVSFDKTSLNFDFLEGSAPSPQTVIGSARGSTDKDILMGAEVNGTGIATPIRVLVDQALRTATIDIAPQAGLAAGSYGGSIKLLACANQACTVQHGGSPYTLPYTITVRPGLKPSGSSLSLAAAETGVSGLGTIGFTPPGSGTVTASVDYLNGQAGWLDAQVSGANLLVRANAAALAPGSYQANVRLAASATGQVVTIPVQLAVGSGLTVAENGAFKVTSGLLASSLQGQVMIALAPGAAATTWSASSDQPWLRMSRASGDFTTQPSWELDFAAFDALPNKAHYTAHIRVATNSTLPAKVYTLDVHKALAELTGLDALALLPGQGGDVLLYGDGMYSSLAYGIYGVSVGAPVTAVANLSEKVTRLTLPALPAGRYNVTLKANSGLSTATKQIIVAAGASYAYQSLDTEGRKSAMVWDAASKSVFVVNQTLKSVMRYADVNGRFQLATTRSFPAVDSIGMTPDRSALVLLSGSSTVYKLSPTDLSTQKTLKLSSYGGGANELSTPLTIMGDNRLMHPSFGWVDLDSGATTPLAFENAWQSSGAASWGAVSGDGMRMIRPDSGLYSPSGPIYRTEVGSDKFSAYNSTTTPYFYRYAVNHDGSAWWLEGNVVDFDLNLRGRTVLPDGWLANQAAMSRDGSRLVQFAQSAVAGTKPRVYVFDTSRAMTTEVNFPVLGYVEFAELPNCPYSSNSGYYDGCYTFETRMALSDDGKTVFIAGDRKFVVVPLPARLAPVASGSGSGSASASRARSVLSGETVIRAQHP